MAKVIIGIHGLGNKVAKEILEKWWTDSIKEGFLKTGKKINLPVFEFVYWADVIYDRPLDPSVTDKSDPCYLIEPYTPMPKEFRLKKSKIRLKIIPYIVRYLKKIILNDDFSLKYPQLTGSIVERYFYDLNIYYKETNTKNDNLKQKAIIERTVSMLKKHKKDEILLIGHSMGSIIAYDVLSYELPDIKIQTFATIGSPLGQPFVISKIATRQHIKQNGSTKLKTPPAITSNWFNFSDIEDPIAINNTLSAEFCENSYGVKPVDILITNDYVIRNKRNPHKSFGYLRSKEFCDVLSSFLEEKRPGLLVKTIQNIKGLFTKKQKTKNINFKL